MLASEARPGVASWRVSPRGVVRALAGIALVVYLVRAGGAWPSLTDLPSALWLLVALNMAGLVGTATEARRLMVLLRAQRIEVPFSTAFRLGCVATLFNLWIPGGTGGDVTKLYYLAGQHRGRGIELATVLVVDRVIALFTLLLLILGLLAVQPGVLRAAPMIGALATANVAVLIGIAAATLVLWSKPLRNTTLYKWLMGRPFFGRHLERAADAAFAFRDHKFALVSAALWCVAGHLILTASLTLSASILLPAVGSLAASTLALLGFIANALPITPGGIGVGEAATETLVRSIGASGGAILMVMWRASTAAICVLGAAFFFHQPVPLARAASSETTQ